MVTEKACWSVDTIMMMLDDLLLIDTGRSGSDR
jgi:hypothetical protein